MADIVELDKYRERGRSPSQQDRKIEYSRLSRREKQIYVAAWITGARDQWRWIQERLAWLLNLEPGEVEEYLDLVAIIGDGLPPAVKELLFELVYQGPKLMVPAGKHRGRRKPRR